MSDKIITHIEALEKARSYCAYQERSQQEVIKKLRSFKLNSDEIDYVLLELIQGKYLNEERFARAYASGKFRIKNWGRRKIKYHLKTKGLTNTCIELGLTEIDEEEYRLVVEKLILANWKKSKEKNSYRKKAKIVSYLYGRGFEMDYLQDVEKIVEKHKI